MKSNTILSAREIIEAITDLKTAGVDLPVPSAQAVREETLSFQLPAWVARAGLLRDRDHFWLYCVPAPAAAAETAGQTLIQLPPGRYLVDTFLAGTHTCVARESAAGNPLVVGLMYAPEPILLWIHPPSRTS